MNYRLSSILKLSILLLVSVLLALSLLSANFYDPTLFHQLDPVEGVQNWCGVLGALIGGTLIELFGPASFLIPWFILKLSYSPNSLIRRISIGYYATVLLLFLSIGHALWWPVDFVELSESAFLGFSGYVGILGAQWVLKFFHSLGASLLVGTTIIFCIIKLFEELPIKLFISSLLNTGILFPIYLLQNFWQKFILLYQWFVRRFSLSKTDSSPQSTSSFDPEHLPPNDIITEQDPSN